MRNCLGGALSASVLGLVVTAAVFGAGAVAATTAVSGAADGSVEQDGSPDSPAGQFHNGPDPDNTITEIQVNESGTATWSLTVRTALDTEDDVEAFETFAEEFEAQDDAVADFRERMTDAVLVADDTVDREMAATQFEAQTEIQEIPRRWGIVRYEFRWDGFAATTGDQLEVGDVFDGGFFLAEDDVLELVGPQEYAVVDTAPSPDEQTNRTLQWNGRADFDHQRPSATFAPEETVGDVGNEDDLVSVSELLPVVVLLVAGGIATVAYRSDRIETQQLLESLVTDTDEAAAGSNGDSTPVDRTDNNEGDDKQSMELTTDEDRVIQLLNEAGGRIRQAEIADQLGWSASKTSRVLSGMESEGEIEKLRIGRENVIDLVEDTDDEAHE